MSNPSFAGNVPAAAPDSAIDTATGRIQGMTNVLHDRIERLERKLESVSTPRPPAGTGAANKLEPVPVRSAHQQNLCNLADRLEALGDRVQSITDALEV